MLPLLLLWLLHAGSAATVLTAAVPPAALLAGDWQAPEVLMVGYHPAWEPSLAALLQAVQPTPVRLLAQAAHRAQAALWLVNLQASSHNMQRVQLAEGSVDSPWVRDYAPLQQRSADGSWRWLQPRYHASRPRDQAFGMQLARQHNVALQPRPWALEGGGIASNGAGLCAMTQASWNGLHARPPYAEQVARLGCQVLVIGPNLDGEPTGHVDMLLQFAAAETALLTAVPEAPSWQAGLQRAAQALHVPLRVALIPTVLHPGGTPYTAVNGLRIGDKFLLPTYAAAAVPAAVQRAAQQALAEAMPQVQMVPIAAAALWDGGGALHCATWGLLGSGGF